MKHQTIQQFFKQFPTDQSCLDHVMFVRYGEKSQCPKCKKDTRWSKVTSQRAYACRMGHEIRKHMAFVDGDETLNGDVEVDETYIGGKKQGKRGRGADGKTILFGMLDRDGDVMVKVVTDTKGKTLKPLISENVEKGSTVHSDNTYKTMRTSSNIGLILGLVLRR